MGLTDWSVFARYFNPGAPVTTFATTLAELEDKYLARRAVSRKYHLVGNLRTFAKLWLRYIDFKQSRNGEENYTALVLENVHGFNIVRSFHKYYAIPQGEGAFLVTKAEKRKTILAELIAHTPSNGSLRKLIAARWAARGPRCDRIEAGFFGLTHVLEKRCYDVVVATERRQEGVSQEVALESNPAEPRREGVA